MNHQDEMRNPELDEIRILIFSIMGTSLGIDMEQISGILGLHEARERNLEWIGFHEKIPFKEEPVVYRSPMILLTRNREIDCGILIEQPEDIDVAIKIDAIRPFPPLIARSIRSGPLWGVILRKEKFIFLADLHKFWETDSL